jgi:hypothetical protein
VTETFALIVEKSMGVFIPGNCLDLDLGLAHGFFYLLGFHQSCQ